MRLGACCFASAACGKRNPKDDEFNSSISVTQSGFDSPATQSPSSRKRVCRSNKNNAQASERLAFFTLSRRMRMLVLSRKCGETIYIGKDIEITVMRVAGNNVKLAIKAPDGVKILRAELRKEGN